MVASQIVQQLPWTWAKLFHAAPAYHISSSLHLADSHWSTSPAILSELQSTVLNLKKIESEVCLFQTSLVQAPCLFLCSMNICVGYVLSMSLLGLYNNVIIQSIPSTAPVELE